MQIIVVSFPYHVYPKKAIAQAVLKKNQRIIQTYKLILSGIAGEAL